jgi:hypothetical protein
VFAGENTYNKNTGEFVYMALASGNEGAISGCIQCASLLKMLAALAFAIASPSGIFAQDLPKPVIAVPDASGNIYVAECAGSRILKVAPDGTISTVAGNGISDSSPDGALAANSSIKCPEGMAVADDGTLYFTEFANIRSVGRDGRLKTHAMIYGQGLTLDRSGNLYIAAPYSNRVYRMASSGVVSVVAGSGKQGFSGDNGPALDAKLHNPADVAIDRAGNLLITDGLNSRIRKVTPAGVITTIAGNGRVGNEGDGGPATEATFWEVDSLAVNAAGDIYISDLHGDHLRVITGSPNGMPIIGRIGSFLPGSSGIRFDLAGNLLIANAFIHSVRKLTPSGGYENVVITVQPANTSARP